VTAHLVCGSPYLWLPETLEGDVVGVDRGALKLIEKGIEFDTAVGDFDSVSEVERQLIAKHVKVMSELPVNKDVTDCEAAVAHVVEKGYRDIYLYGVTGGRLDHMYAATILMLKYVKQGVSIWVRDEQNKMFVLAPGYRHTIKVKDKNYLSFFALERSVRALSLEGVKYPLDGYDLDVDDSLCVSNEAIWKRVLVSFGMGYLLVIQSSD